MEGSAVPNCYKPPLLHGKCYPIELALIELGNLTAYTDPAVNDQRSYIPGSDGYRSLDHGYSGYGGVRDVLGLEKEIMLS